MPYQTARAHTLAASPARLLPSAATTVHGCLYSVLATNACTRVICQRLMCSGDGARSLVSLLHVMTLAAPPTHLADTHHVCQGLLAKWLRWLSRLSREDNGPPGSLIIFHADALVLHGDVMLPGCNIFACLPMLQAALQQVFGIAWGWFTLEIRPCQSLLNVRADRWAASLTNPANLAVTALVRRAASVTQGLAGSGMPGVQCYWSATLPGPVEEVVRAATVWVDRVGLRNMIRATVADEIERLIGYPFCEKVMFPSAIFPDILRVDAYYRQRRLHDKRNTMRKDG